MEKQISELMALPNIGKVLAEKLIEIKITSAEKLQAAGTEKIFKKLYKADPEACCNKLYAIEGAVQGIRWHSLTKERKAELKEFFDKIKK